MGKLRIPQKTIKPLGAFFEALYLALPLLSIINFISISAILYTQVQDYLKDWIPWMNFPIFLGIIGVLTLVMVLLTWIFLVPSMWAIRGQQMFGRDVKEDSKKEDE